MAVVHEARLVLRACANDGSTQTDWEAPADTAAIAAAGLRLAATRKALRAAFPAFHVSRADRGLTSEWAINGVPREAAVARLRRMVCGYVTVESAIVLEVEVTDRSATLVTVLMTDETAAQREARVEALALAATTVCAATGFAPVSRTHDTPTDTTPAAFALAVAEAAAARLQRDRQVGWVGFVILNALALGLAAWLVVSGQMVHGRLVPMKPATAATFLVVAAPGLSLEERLLPGWPLGGTIVETGEAARITVSRRARAEAAPGDTVTVYRGRYPEEPWLEPRHAARFGPIMGYGPLAPTPWALLGLALAAIWATTVVQFYIRKAAFTRAGVRAASWTWLALICGLAGVLWLLGR